MSKLTSGKPRVERSRALARTQDTYSRHLLRQTTTEVGELQTMTFFAKKIEQPSKAKRPPSKQLHRANNPAREIVGQVKVPELDL